MANQIKNRQTMMSNADEFTTPRLLHTREDSAGILSISVRSLDYHIAKGRHRVKHHGASVLIHHSELVRFAKEDHPDAGAAPARREPIRESI
jgi:hypothetical protein